jgi:hypothetical protein
MKNNGTILEDDQRGHKVEEVLICNKGGEGARKGAEEEQDVARRG